VATGPDESAVVGEEAAVEGEGLERDLRPGDEGLMGRDASTESFAVRKVGSSSVLPISKTSRHARRRKGFRRRRRRRRRREVFRIARG